MSPQLLVVDDHEAARFGLKCMFNGTSMQVAMSTGTSEEALIFMAQQPFSAVIMDIRMPGMSGLELLEKIRQSEFNVPVVVLSSYDNPTYIARAAALGANDYILKNTERQGLIDAVSRAINAEGAVPEGRFHQIREKMLNEVDLTQFACDWPLTSRESQVLLHIALGLSNKEIAKSLMISVETVKEHVQNILRKLGANDRTDAAVKAVRVGFID
ncbi:response regulator transcription factor [Novipirellula sp. SH528]|uniref:response regulator transcription factor n=1 Tax=Novipirellula sp. SH528 TaxID=3454466 RepID=UPI003FA14A43